MSFSETDHSPHAATSRMLLFQRKEVKYLVDRTTRTALTADLKAFMRPDVYSSQDGSYLVRSLYFDTNYHMAYHEKLSGAAIRHKLRIRAYGLNPREAKFVRLEVKSRYLSHIHKITVDVPTAQYEAMEPAVMGRSLPPEQILNDSRISKEFFRLQRQYNMVPKIMVQYRREAYERNEIHRVRANFDDEILGSRELNLLDPLQSARPLLKNGNAVFEIKVDGTMPFWLHHLISKYDLQDQAFSKFTNSVRSEALFSTFARQEDLN